MSCTGRHISWLSGTEAEQVDIPEADSVTLKCNPCEQTGRSQAAIQLAVMKRVWYTA